MPLASAMRCQSPPRPAFEASPCTVAPAGACVSGRVPGVAGAPSGPAPCLNSTLRIFCCDRFSDMVARSGLPSCEKNSSDSSSESIRPSNWNEPHKKRTPGGMSLVGSCVSFCGVMKKTTFCVSLRTSSTDSSPSGIGALTSNQSCKLSLVVPAPTNWRPAEPLFWSPEPPPDGVAIWLAKLSLSASGLNCTVTFCPLGFASHSLFDLSVSSCSTAFSNRTDSGIYPQSLRLFQRQRFVSQLKLLDGHHPVLGVEGRRFELNRQTAR